MAASREVERTWQAALPTSTPVSSPTAFATLVPTPGPYVVDEGDVERGREVFLDCLATNPQARAWFTGVMVSGEEDPVLARGMADLLLSSGKLLESVFLQSAEEEPVFKVQLALYAEYGGDLCAVFDVPDGSLGGEKKHWDGGLCTMNLF